MAIRLRNTPEKYLNLIPILFILLGIFWIYIGQRAQADKSSITRKISTENNAYLRLNACIVSVQPAVRIPAYVRLCYNQVDKSNDVQLTRYGDGK